VQESKAVLLLLHKVLHLPELHTSMMQARVANPDITVNTLSEFMHRHQELKNKMECVGPTKGKRVVGLTADAAPQPLPPVTHAPHAYVTLPLNASAYNKHALASHPTETTQQPRAQGYGPHNQSRHQAFGCLLHGPHATHSTDNCRELQHMLSARRHVAQTPTPTPDISDLARQVASHLSMGQQNNVAPEMHTAHGPSRAYPQPRLPRHEACGRHHPPGVQCYGPGWNPYQQPPQPPATSTQPSSSQAPPAPARASPGNSPARTQRQSHLASHSTSRICV